MTRATLLLARRLGAGLAAAHLAGLLLLALILGVEAADRPLSLLVELWRARLPALWAQASPMLTLAGAALAVFRMRRDGVLLALGSFGVAPARALAVGAVLGVGLGLAAGALADPTGVRADTTWVRGDGGWFHGEDPVPDTIGGAVRRRALPERRFAAPAAFGGTAALLGGAVGLWSGGLAAVTAGGGILLAAAITDGLVARGAWPPGAGWLPPALAACVVVVAARFAPLFPRRWA